jgi:small-conductance mechanosensitive channel
MANVESLPAESVWGFVSALIPLIIAALFFFLVYRAVERWLLKRMKTKKQVSNARMILSVLKYVFAAIIIAVFLSSYFGSWREISIIAGLFTAAMGWALQKPITGALAWLIISIRRPFRVGDIVIMSDMKGEVRDITLTHIYLEEVGGTVREEELSGRSIILPNSLYFEREIVNYSAHDDFMLDEVVVSVTYESSLAKAEEIAQSAARKSIEQYLNKMPSHYTKDPYTRVFFRSSGIDVSVRYYTPVLERARIGTEITREIFQKIRAAKDVEIAYPHTEVVFREKEQRA